MIQQKGLIIHPEEISAYWNEQLLASSVNLLGIHPAGGLTAGKTIEDAIECLQEEETRQLLEQLISQGIDIEYEMHALSWLLPRELFQKYPAWFRMNERHERTDDFNFCPSNTDALAYITERAAVLAKIFRPTTHRYHFWLDDVASSRCHCPACARLSPSDASLLVYNAILKGIRTVDPAAYQCYLAYHDTLNAPRTVEPAEGIFLEYAPMNRDLHRPLNDPHSEKNLSQIRPLDELLRVFGTKNAKALDYWLDNSYLSGWKKPPKHFTPELDIIRCDTAFYAEKGFEIVTTFACYLGEDYFALYNEKPDIAAYGRAFPKHGRNGLPTRSL